MLISYAAEVAENEKGSYIESMYIKGDKLYLTDLFGHFAQQGTPQYVGAYHFMEGDFLLYRCKP